MKPKAIIAASTAKSPAETPVFTIHSPHFSQAPLSLTLDHLDQVAAAHRDDEIERMIDLIVSRAVVPISPVDRVEVVEDALTAARVRLIDGSERGRQGWVPAAWLRAAGIHHGTNDINSPVAADQAA